MTPQEKAKEIYCKYTNALNIRDLQITANPFAKQCALITVDEIINTGLLLGKERYNLYPTQYHDFWHQVKSEIEKL